MARVLSVVESQVKLANGRETQRVIFSDDKIVYVDVETGEVKPDSTPDKYVDLISLYNSANSVRPVGRSTDGRTQSSEASRLRRIAADIDLLFVILVGILGIFFLMNGGFFIVLLLWMIPMTAMTYSSVRDDNERVALGVCHILFFNIISGILILKSNSYVSNPFNEGRW